MTPFDEIEPGARIELGVWTVDADDTIAFARQFDPQRFHLSEEAAAETYFGRLSASGWQTAGMWMHFMVAHHDRVRRDREAAGLPVARMGPSPGFDDMRWPKPVYPGDQIAYSTTVLDKRLSASRPEWGIVRHRNEAVNQHGDLVFSFLGTVFIAR
jgi:acyl dehydratase